MAMRKKTMKSAKAANAKKASGAADMAANAIKPGLRVFVSAGAGGIGLAIADTFAAQGARVYICDVAAKALKECLKARPHFLGLRADVGDEKSVDRVFADMKKRLGGLDVLVNNAGIAGPTAGVDKIAPRDWRRTIDINLNGQFYCARRAVPMLRKAGEGAMRPNVVLPLRAWFSCIANWASARSLRIHRCSSWRLGRAPA